MKAGIDVLGRTTASIGAHGRRTEYLFDSAGRGTKTITNVGTDKESVTEQVYDSAGRVWKTISSAPNQTGPGAATTYTYDDAGNRVRRDSAGISQSWDYDELGRTTAQWTSPTGSTGTQAHLITVQYEEPGSGPSAGQVIGQTDGSGRSVILAYGPDGRVAQRSMTGPSGVDAFTYSYGYDTAGNVISVTDSRDPSHPVTQSFDTTGHLIEFTDTTGDTYRWRYGASGQVTTRTLPDAAREVSVYDLNGQLARTVIGGYYCRVSQRLVATSDPLRDAGLIHRCCFAEHRLSRYGKLSTLRNSSELSVNSRHGRETRDRAG